MLMMKMVIYSTCKSSLKDTATYHGFNLTSSDFDVLPLSNSQFDSLLNEMGDVEIDNVLSQMPIPNTVSSYSHYMSSRNLGGIQSMYSSCT
jgi:hypothetical protein